MLTSTTNTVEVTGSSATSYTFNQPIHKAEDLNVYVSGVEVPTSGGSNPHTVTVAANKLSASVVFATAPGAVDLKFERIVDYKQETDLANNSLFDAESLETSLDNIVMQTQQAGISADSSFGFDPGLPTTTVGFNTTVRAAATLNRNKSTRALKALCFDSNGDITISTDNIDAQIATVAASATAASASATSSASSATASAASLAEFQGIYRGSSTSTPGSPNDGDLWFDTNTGVNVMKAYNSDTTAWEQLTPTSTNQTNINAAVADATDIGVVAGKETEIGRLGTADTVADMVLLGTTACVADMAILATTDIVADMALLGTTDCVADMAILGTSDVVADLAILATSDIVTDLSILGTTAVVEDMALLGTSACVADMAILGTSAIVADLDALADVDAELALLGTSAMVASIALIGTTAYAHPSTGDIKIVADSIADVNRYANEYKIAASEPGSPSEGDLWMDTTNNVFKVHNGTSFVTVTEGQTEEEVNASSVSMAIALG